MASYVEVLMCHCIFVCRSNCQSSLTTNCLTVRKSMILCCMQRQHVHIITHYWLLASLPCVTLVVSQWLVMTSDMKKDERKRNSVKENSCVKREKQELERVKCKSAWHPVSFVFVHCRNCWRRFRVKKRERNEELRWHRGGRGMKGGRRSCKKM